MTNRNIVALTKKGNELMQIIKEGQVRDVVDLMSQAEHVGSGQYNINYRLSVPNDSVVIRVSRYKKNYLQGVADAVMNDATFLNKFEAELPLDKVESSQQALSRDSVRIKNNIAYITNLLIRENICPHYVYMLGEADVRGFYAYVGIPNPHKDFKRYTNVSLHESYQTNLMDAMRTTMKTKSNKTKPLISPLQLKCVIFQVIHGIMMLQHYLPGFRHNDLRPDNILLRFEDSTNNRNTTNKNNNTNNKNLDTKSFRDYMVYTGEATSTNFEIPDVGVFAAISDFDLANAPIAFNQIHESHGLPGSMRGNTLMNDMISNSRHFEDQQAAGLLRNIGNQSFDMFQFLKALHDTLAEPKNEPMRSTYDEAWQWLSSFRIFSEPRYAPLRYTPDSLDALFPRNVLQHGTYFRFPKTSSSPKKVKPIAQYFPKPLGITLQYLGDDDERYNEAERKAVEKHPKAQTYEMIAIKPDLSSISRLKIGHFQHFALSNQAVYMLLY